MSGGYFDSGWQGDGGTCGVCGRVMTDGPCACAAKPRVIEFHIPPKIPQCKVCGKVRVGNAWIRDNTVQPDLTVWACPGCGEKQKRRQVRDLKAGQQQVRKNARTPHPVRVLTAEDWKDLMQGKRQ